MADVEAFAAGWGLDATSRSVLEQLSQQARQAVMESFAPKASTQNVDRLFQGFARSVQSTELCTAFCQQQGFDQGCLDALLALGLDQRETVANEFSPKPGTRNPQGLFLGFCRSVKDGSGSKAPPKAAGANRAVDMAAHAEALEWQQGAFAAAAAHAEAEALQALQAQLNASAAVPSEEELAVFLQQWDLDASCTSVLRSQPADVQRHVLENFAPKQGTRNVNSLFMGFLKSITSGGVAHATAAAGGMGHGQAVALGAAYGNSAALQAQAAFGIPGVSEEEVTQFSLSWDLDMECVTALLGQPQEVVTHVMQTFRPKPGTRNVKSLFMGFLKSILTGGVGQQGGIAGAAGGWGAGAGASGGAGAVGAIGAVGFGGASFGGAGFGGAGFGGASFGGAGFGSAGFGGAGLSTGRTPLWGGRPAPPVHAARAPAMGAGMGMGGMGMKRGPDVAFGAWNALSTFAPTGMQTAEVSVGDDEILQFAQTWGLDNECLTAMIGQLPDVQRDVIERFKPKTGTRDVKSLFMGFLKSRAMGPGAGKRPRMM